MEALGPREPCGRWSDVVFSRGLRTGPGAGGDRGARGTLSTSDVAGVSFSLVPIFVAANIGWTSG